jgi:hypothetical protein
MNIKTLTTFFVAAAYAGAVYSSDDALFAELTGEKPAAQQGNAAPVANPAAPVENAENTAAAAENAGDNQNVTPSSGEDNKRNLFFTLPKCLRLDGGNAEVLVPGSNLWIPIEEGRHYPLGSSYRTIGKRTKLRISFGLTMTVIIVGEAEFGTLPQKIGTTTRTVTLSSGTITVSVPNNTPEGAFIVSAPGFEAINLAGASRYTYTKSGDGDTAIVRCVTGKMDIRGRHFKVRKMRAANELKIRTSHDMLFTGLFGLRGDCDVKLDQGRFIVKDLESGEDKIQDKYLDWKLSPRTAVRIYRAKASIGEKMSVTILTFNDVGALKNRCAFAENLYEINTGELGPTSKKEREELAKRAAEANETAAAQAGAAETVDVPASAPAPQPAAKTVPKQDAGLGDDLSL